MFRKTAFATFFVLFACLGLAQAAATDESLHLDIHEGIIRVPFTAADFNGKQTTGDIVITHFRPDGEGPFPLVVISHGRDSKTRAQMARARFESAARYFVRKGFAVAVPTRLGYSETAALGDPEASGICDKARFAPALEASSSEIEASVIRMQQERWVQANHVLLLGQSVGGISTVAAASRNIPGMLAAINFAGGHGGDPEKHPGVPCNPKTLEAVFDTFGQKAHVPMLWIYTENDQYFSPTYSRSWHATYVTAGGKAEYRLLPAFRENGHTLFANGNDLWQPIVDTWLAGFGFSRPGVLARPPINPNTRVDEADRVPYLSAKSKDTGYADFLAKPAPRAFAINAKGNWGWASGEDDLLSRALANCQKKSGVPCKLYAVDNDVIWQPE